VRKESTPVEPTSSYYRRWTCLRYDRSGTATVAGAKPRESTLQDSKLHESKRALRASAIAARDALPQAYRESASRAIAATLAARADFAAAHTLLMTLPFGSEWDTRMLLTHARARGLVVAMPRVNAATRMLELFRLADDKRDVAVGHKGIPEPASHCEPVSIEAIDWILAPGVAFDIGGHRLGYGGGFYDRLLPLLRPDAPRVAGAFDVQVVDHVPIAPHDQRLDAIVTESRTLSISRAI
jgi:5-formyltetrahydrofolate cyclo-ligase